MIYTNEIINKRKIKAQKRKKILKIITTPFVILIIMLAIYISYMKYIKHEANISILGFRQYIVMTGSMEPNYNIGDLVIVKSKKIEDIKENDVINYLLPNSTDTVTHRITKVFNENGQTMYRTKGDNNNAEDPDSVSYNQIHGVILFKISHLGYILTQLFTGFGITFVLIITIFSFLHANRKEEKRIAREDLRKIYNIPKYEKENNL